jgi:hypothetical protein
MTDEYFETSSKKGGRSEFGTVVLIWEDEDIDENALIESLRQAGFHVAPEDVSGDTYLEASLLVTRHYQGGDEEIRLKNLVRSIIVLHGGHPNDSNELKADELDQIRTYIPHVLN